MTYLLLLILSLTKISFQVETLTRDFFSHFARSSLRVNEKKKKEEEEKW